MSRPTAYTAPLADAICNALAAGRSLRSICKQDDMPGRSTVFRWLQSNAEFRNQYTVAREIACDALVEEMLDIADDEASDIDRDKLRIEERQWLVSRLRPRKYGIQPPNR